MVLSRVPIQHCGSNPLPDKFHHCTRTERNGSVVMVVKILPVIKHCRNTKVYGLPVACFHKMKENQRSSVAITERVRAAGARGLTSPPPGRQLRRRRGVINVYLIDVSCLHM